MCVCVALEREAIVFRPRSQTAVGWGLEQMLDTPVVLAVAGNILAK